MKIGLYGGSFDPIHFGHIRPVREARRQLGLGQVLYLPTAFPPHKREREFAPAHARYAMVELALLREEGLYVSDLELAERPVFTIETVERLHAARPDDQLHLLIGGDSFAELESWKRWRELVELVRLAVLVRPGWEIERTRARLSAELTRLAASDRVRFIGNRPVRISSTDLRRRLAAGEQVPRGSMPALVLEYVRKYSLYR